MPLFRKRSMKASERRGKEGAKSIPFASWELSYAKHHGLRALCGLLMDRHSACTVCPFCGDPDQDGLMQLIVNVEMQTDGRTGEPVLALYFSKAEYPSGSEAENIDDWASRLTYAEAVPIRKAVVQLLDDGSYVAEYGTIANPTEGDYSTGALNREDWTLQFNCDPEPAYARWQYWESTITSGQQVVPQFCCLRTPRREWWIVDRDYEQANRYTGQSDRGMVSIITQQVAGLEVADNPHHVGDRPEFNAR